MRPQAQPLDNPDGEVSLITVATVAMDDDSNLYDEAAKTMYEQFDTTYYRCRVENWMGAVDDTEEYFAQSSGGYITQEEEETRRWIKRRMSITRAHAPQFFPRPTVAFDGRVWDDDLHGQAYRAHHGRDRLNGIHQSTSDFRPHQGDVLRAYLNDPVHAKPLKPYAKGLNGRRRFHEPPPFVLTPDPYGACRYER